MRFKDISAEETKNLLSSEPLLLLSYANIYLVYLYQVSC